MHLLPQEKVWPGGAKSLAASAEATMEDVTSAVERAGTCLRDLWNTYFYAGDNVSSYPAVLQDLYDEIENRVFGALLLLRLGRLAFMEKFRLEPLPFLVVVPAQQGVRLMINRPSTDGNRYWDDFDGRVGPNEVVLHFVEWFDWNVYGRRAFQYYQAKVHAFEKRPEFIGRDALIECQNARVLFDSEIL